MKRLSVTLTLLLFAPGAFGGCISGDCKNGVGTYTWRDGSKYVGEWKDGNQHGQGTQTWANGQKYVGEWKDGLQHGQGTSTNSLGKTKTGVWEMDSYVGTKAEWEAAKKRAELKAAKEKRIYDACLLEKGADVDMQVPSLHEAVTNTCRAIAEDPSWFEELKYD